MIEQNLTYDEKLLGKITCATFGMGGYQEAQFGLNITLEGKGWGTGTTISGGWCYGLIEPDSQHHRWTEADRTKSMVRMCREVAELLIAAKVTDVSRLVGKPVEAIFNGNTLKSWRILTEVL